MSKNADIKMFKTVIFACCLLCVGLEEQVA